MQATQNQQKSETDFEKIPFTMQFMRWATLLGESLQLLGDPRETLFSSSVTKARQPAEQVWCFCFRLSGELSTKRASLILRFTSRLHLLTCIKTPPKKLAPVLRQILKFHVVRMTSALCWSSSSWFNLVPRVLSYPPPWRERDSEIILFWSHVTSVFQGLSLCALKHFSDRENQKGSSVC